MTNAKLCAIMKSQKRRANNKAKPLLKSKSTGGKIMKYTNPKLLLKTAMEVNVPFVDKTRTMTGRVSENI